ncbi:hypothetical protein AC249_AIPGENE18581 [Exaiptasia diaphana]|nr:hypothetical protein AC249_AIPGENE18581 [Exaiptasia diaphana]
MHLLTHQDKELRMQKCDLCGKELLSRRWVSKHRQRCLKKLMEGKDGKTKKTREPRQEYTCDVCSRVFKYRANFDTHCKKAHVPGAEEKKKPTSSKKTTKNKVACPICQKKFLYISCVKKHLQKRHAGVEMAVPENMQSASNLKDSSFAITSGEDSRVVIRSSASKTNEQSQESTSSSSASQVEVIPIVQPVPTIHIQPTGNPSSSQKSVTFIFVPSTTSNTKPVKPVKSTKAVKQSTNGSSASYSVSRNEEVSKEKAPETGSQAISALKKLSAKVGIQDPNGSEEHRKTVQSKHLSALEQLNKRVGDYGSVALETVHPAPPRDQVPSQDHLASRDAQVRDLPNVVETVTSEKTDERREVTTTIVSRSVQQNQIVKYSRRSHFYHKHMSQETDNNIEIENCK